MFKTRRTYWCIYRYIARSPPYGRLRHDRTVRRTSRLFHLGASARNGERVANTHLGRGFLEKQHICSLYLIVICMVVFVKTKIMVLRLKCLKLFLFIKNFDHPWWHINKWIEKTATSLHDDSDSTKLRFMVLKTLIPGVIFRCLVWFPEN